MGHTRVGVLPETPRWRQVRLLIAEGANSQKIAAGIVRAAVRVFGNADKQVYGRLADEPGAVWATWLLMTIPFVARQELDLPVVLRRKGIDLSSSAWENPARFIAEASEQLRRKTWRQGAITEGCVKGRAANLPA